MTDKRRFGIKADLVFLLLAYLAVFAAAILTLYTTQQSDAADNEIETRLIVRD